jgi:hypothetical protein
VIADHIVESTRVFLVSLLCGKEGIHVAGLRTRAGYGNSDFSLPDGKKFYYVTGSVGCGWSLVRWKKVGILHVAKLRERDVRVMGGGYEQGIECVGWGDGWMVLVMANVG